MKVEISSSYMNQKDKILSFIENFDRKGNLLGNGERNKIKLFNLNGITINIKSFKIPNAVNTIAYRFFRKSKAERSYKYAQILLSKGIGTPHPIAYAEENSAFAFKRSYYVSEQVEYDLTYRELVQQPDYPENEKILRAFTRFSYKLHENDVEFLDHSPGNTLIKANGGNYQFFLVDLNRMNFKKLDFEERMKNLSRLTPKKEMVHIMANEYSKVSKEPEEQVFEKMWKYTQEFQEKFQRKQRLKKKLKFWKKN